MRRLRTCKSSFETRSRRALPLACVPSFAMTAAALVCHGKTQAPIGFATARFNGLVSCACEVARYDDSERSASGVTDQTERAKAKSAAASAPNSSCSLRRRAGLVAPRSRPPQGGSIDTFISPAVFGAVRRVEAGRVVEAEAAAGDRTLTDCNSNALGAHPQLHFATRTPASRRISDWTIPRLHLAKRTSGARPGALPWRRSYISQNELSAAQPCSDIEVTFRKTNSPRRCSRSRRCGRSRISQIEVRALQSMIPKSWYRFSERSCANNKLERDDESKKSHLALAGC
jgi:hypothetical protein